MRRGTLTDSWTERGGLVREIDLIPIRLHKGEPTWEIIDGLLEHIDAAPSEDEVKARVEDAWDDAYHNGMDAGYDNGYDDGFGDGTIEGYTDGYEDGKGWIGD